MVLVAVIIISPFRAAGPGEGGQGGGAADSAPSLGEARHEAGDRWANGAISGRVQ